MADIVYGVTPTGFVLKRLQDILISLNQNFQQAFGIDLDVSSDTPNGQFNGIMAEPIAQIWQQLQALYNGMDPRQATGDSLTNIGVINYLKRDGQSRSSVTQTFNGTNGTFINAAIFQCATETTNFPFILQQSITIPPSGTIDAQCVSVAYGPVPAPANTLTIINTPITGLTSITNAADAILGRLVETDPEFRIRRIDSTSVEAQQLTDALIGKLKSLTGVIDADVIANNLDVPDSHGFLPHSIAAIVEGGSDQDIAETIFTTNISSIPTNGNIEVDVPNSKGLLIPIFFYRAVQVPIYIYIQIHAYSGFPSNGLVQIQQNVYTFLTGIDAVTGAVVGDPFYTIGSTIIISQLYCAINQTPGASVRELLVDTVHPAVNANDLVLDFNQIPTFELVNISVVSV